LDQKARAEEKEKEALRMGERPEEFASLTLRRSYEDWGDDLEEIAQAIEDTLHPNLTKGNWDAQPLYTPPQQGRDHEAMEKLRNREGGVQGVTTSLHPTGDWAAEVVRGDDIVLVRAHDPADAIHGATGEISPLNGDKGAQNTHDVGENHHTQNPITAEDNVGDETESAMPEMSPPATDAGNVSSVVDEVAHNVGFCPDVVERLERAIEIKTAGETECIDAIQAALGDGFRHVVATLAQGALIAIYALQAEVDRLATENIKYTTRIGELEAENERLREALKPFARLQTALGITEEQSPHRALNVVTTQEEENE